jgi:RHS repeat-associated protein
MAHTTTNYDYDQANRLTAVGLWSYGYNGDGLRMTKELLLSPGPNPDANPDTNPNAKPSKGARGAGGAGGAGGLASIAPEYFSWDIGIQGGLPLLLQDNRGTYIYGPGGMLLEQVSTDEQPYYYMTDRLGSVRALTSAGSSPAVVNTYKYDAYGQPLTTSETVANPFRYTGEYLDEESGFIYLRARYYDPESQQFLTVDPALAWTEEAYAYVGGSPTNATDPSGLNPLDDWLAEAKREMCENIGLFCDGDPQVSLPSSQYNPFADVFSDVCRDLWEDFSDPTSIALMYGVGGVRFKGEFTAPILPPHEIVNERGVIIDHNYYGNDHAPPHLHVEGNGPSTRIGQNGKPLEGSPELSSMQKKVIEDNLGKIRTAVRKIGRYFWFNNRQDK